MPADRIKQRIESKKGRLGAALVPYFTAGYPDIETTIELTVRANALGVPVVEIGFPYSDSTADGPVIQASFYRALDHGHRLADAFNIAQRVRSEVDCALVAMVSYSIVHRLGLDTFMVQAAGAGFDGVILPDVPLEESGPTAEAAHRRGLCHIGLIAPTTSAARRESIARGSSGFIYHIAVAGTTGERADLPCDLPSQVASLRRVSGLPVCVGFGISRPGHVREVCGFADGAIVGSAIVRRITDAVDQGLGTGHIVESVSRFLSDLLYLPPQAES